MTHSEILFDNKELCKFEGRNGTFKCIGIAINGYENYICMMPINSRGTVGRCMIDFETTKIDELISALQQIKDDLQDNTER